jgi:hypothetical protein
MVSEGYGLQVIANHFGISRPRVSQIVSEYHAGIADDDNREIIRTQLDSYLETTLHPIIFGPGQPLYATGSGKLVLDPDGNIIYDKRINIEAINVALRVQERKSRLMAYDRPKAKEKDETGEISEAMAYVESLTARKKELEALVAQYEQHGIVDAEPG